MKRYEAEFSVKEGKIPMVKLVKSLTSMGLAEAKRFVEDKWNFFDAPIEVTVIVTEQQLGKFFISSYLCPTGAFTLRSFKEIPDNDIVDLTQL